jgi:hypothetical protein
MLTWPWTASRGDRPHGHGQGGRVDCRDSVAKLRASIYLCDQCRLLTKPAAQTPSMQASVRAAKVLSSVPSQVTPRFQQMQQRIFTHEETQFKQLSSE